MGRKEELKQQFPHLSEEILAGLIPVILKELLKEDGVHAWGDEDFRLWFNRTYQDRMRELDEEIRRMQE